MISYGGNFAGALALVALVASSGAFNEAAAVGPCAIAEYKCHHTWLQVDCSPAQLTCHHLQITKGAVPISSATTKSERMCPSVCSTLQTVVSAESSLLFCLKHPLHHDNLYLYLLQSAS